MLKQMFKQAWQDSDNQQSLQNALKNHGFWLAKGDRRGFVAVDYKGEVYLLSRWMDVKTKELKQHLNQPEHLPSVQEVKVEIGQSMGDALKKHIDNVHQQRKHEYAPLKRTVQTLKTHHHNQRDTLKNNQEARWQQEEHQRIARLPKGLSGIWQRITGKYQKIKVQNEVRDSDEKHALINQQLMERQRLQERIILVRDRYNQDMLELRKDIGHYQVVGEQALRDSQTAR
jgi:hypothetical protein